MANSKKVKSKLTENYCDFMNESQFLCESPKNKKQPKRRANPDVETPLNRHINKKTKLNEDIEAYGDTRQKILNVMRKQLDSRKQTNENLTKSLSEIISHLEADYNTHKENEQKMEQLTGTFTKCMQQVSAAYKQKLKGFKEIQSIFKKEVEGLLLRGAMKPDDRPLWFDVYKSFPPTIEPKFARPPPENKPIRQILYKEDLIRAKFHMKGHGLGSNMLSPVGETQTKKLIKKYEQFKSEGVPEEELVEKSVTTVGRDRQVDTLKVTPKNPDSVTANVLAEANIQSIFKE